MKDRFEERLERSYDQRPRLMTLNRFIAKPKLIKRIYLIFAVLAFFTINYMLNILSQYGKKLGAYANSEIVEVNWNVLNAFQFSLNGLNIMVYIVLIISLIIGYFYFTYKVKTSHEDLNVGQKGTDRWTTTEEIIMQYKKVREK